MADGVGNSWLWENEQLSDAKLRLMWKQGVDDKPAPKRRRGHGAQDQGACVMDLSVHRTVLASTSGYWKSLFLRWDDKPEANSKRAAAKGPKAAQADANCQVLEVQVDSPESAVAAHLVLQCAYTDMLPKSATALQLLQMAMWADKWAMPSVLSTCMTAVASIKDLPLPDLEQVLQLQLPEDIKSREGYKTLQQQLGSTLCQYVGPAQDVVMKDAKLSTLCNLSLEAVLLWAAQDQLQTDSEDTVAVLLTHWRRRNVCKKEDRAEQRLTEVLRAGQLSKAFLTCVVDELDWFVCGKGSLSLLRMVHGTNLQKQQQQVIDSLLPGWLLPPRVTSVQEMKPIIWTVTKRNLDGLHREGLSGYMLCSPSVCWHGVLWQVCLRLESMKSALSFGIHYGRHPALPKDYDDPPVLFPTIELSVRKGHGQETTHWSFSPQSPFMRGSHYFCSELFLGVLACEDLRAHSYPPDEFWVDGKLHFEARVTRFE